MPSSLKCRIGGAVDRMGASLNFVDNFVKNLPSAWRKPRRPLDSNKMMSKKVPKNALKSTPLAQAAGLQPMAFGAACMGNGCGQSGPSAAHV
jgi:hypothetical protein